MSASRIRRSPRRARRCRTILAIAASHVVTTLTGSALLALALMRGLLAADEVWAAAYVDEDWNSEQWGVDEEVGGPAGGPSGRFQGRRGLSWRGSRLTRGLGHRISLAGPNEAFMSISINPIFPVIAAQGVAPDAALQPGTVIDAQVQKILANDLVRIAIASLTIEVLSEIPLEVGQTLQLAVSQTAQGLKLSVVGQSGLPNLAAAATPAKRSQQTR